MKRRQTKMSNKTFYVRYGNNQPVEVETHRNSELEARQVPLENVGHLIIAFQTRPNSVLAKIDASLLTIHYQIIPGSRATLLPSEFHVKDSVAPYSTISPPLKISTKLTSLGNVGMNDDYPLIVLKGDIISFN